MGTIRLNTVIQDSITDGPGINLVLVTQGCLANCKGCHNPDTHPLDGGREMMIGPLFNHITESTTGVTVSGGEPLLQLEAVKEVYKIAKEKNLKRILYTGFSCLKFLDTFPDFANYLDYVKIGPYIESMRSSAVPYYGSTNQEIYEVKNGELVVWREQMGVIKCGSMK